MQTFQYRSFTQKGEGGNTVQIVICPHGKFPDDSVMGEMAGRPGASQTAFIVNDCGKIRIRCRTAAGSEGSWSTCAVAAFRALADEGLAVPGEDFRLYAPDFISDVKVEKRFVSMTMPQARVLSMVRNQESVNLIFKALGAEYQPVSFMPSCGCFRNMEPMVVICGEPVLIVPINGRDTLDSLKPDFPLIREISKGLKCSGIYAFAFETKDIGTMAHCRGFYPLLGIDESAADASGAAALSFYLNGFGLFPQGREALYIQGEAMGSASGITAFIRGKGASMEIMTGGESAPV